MGVVDHMSVGLLIVRQTFFFIFFDTKLKCPFSRPPGTKAVADQYKTHLSSTNMCTEVIFTFMIFV